MNLYRINEVPDPTGQLADLLSELFDSSALVEADPDYEAAAELLHLEFCYDECRWPSRDSWTHAVRPIIDAAFHIDSPEET